MCQVLEAEVYLQHLVHEGASVWNLQCKMMFHQTMLVQYLSDLYTILLLLSV